MTKRTLSRAALAALLFNATARAVDLGWDAGGGLDNTWDNIANWLPDALPGSNDNIILTGTSADGPITIDLEGTRRINRVEINGASGSYTFDNSAAGALEIFLLGGNALLNQTAGADLIVNVDVLFEASNVTLRFDSANATDTSGQIVVNGAVRPSDFAAGTQTLVLTSTNKTLADRVVVNGVISDGPNATMSLHAGLDAGTVTGMVDHSAEVSVTGLNTYTGLTTVTGGKLKFNSIGNVGGGASALGAPTSVANGSISVGSDSVTGTLRYAGTDPAGHSSDRVIHIPGFDSGATIEASGVGPLTLTGGITTASSSTPRTLVLGGTNTGNNVMGGVIPQGGGSGVLQLSKNGTGKWILTAANEYEGSTSVNAGELVVQGGGRIGHPTFAVGALSIGATLTVDGGTIEVTNLNNFGTLNFRSGDVTLRSSNTTGGGGSFVIGTAGAGTLTLEGGSKIFGNVALDGADDALLITGGGTYTFTNLGNSAGGTLSAAVANLQISGGTITTTHGNLASAIIGSGGLTKVGSGTLTLSAGNAYSGATHVQAGTLVMASAALLGDATTVTVDAGATLEYTAGTADAIFGLNGGGTVENDRLLVIGNSVAPGSAGGVGTFSGSMLGTGGLEKRGAGTFTFAGDGTYTGLTEVENGTFILTGVITGTSGVAVVDGPLSGGGTLTIDGGAIFTNGVVTAEVSTSTLTLNGGVIAASQIDVAAGTAYASTFNWNAGTIRLTGGGGVEISGGSAGANKPFGSSLFLGSARTLIVDNTTLITGTGLLRLAGGTLTTGTLSFDGGAFEFDSGTLRFTENQTFDTDFAAAANVDAALTAVKTLQVDGTATIDTPISVAGGTLTVQTVINPQNLVLDSGTFNVTAGALAVPAGETVDASSGMTINASGGLTVPATAEFNAIGTTLNADAASTNDGQINAINSTLTFTGGLSGSGTMNLIGTTVNGTVNLAGAGAIITSGDTVFHANVLGDGSLAVTSGVTTLSAGGSRVIVVDGVSVLSARLDLTDNKLIVAAGDAGSWNGSTYTGVAGLVDSGRGSAGNAQWDGSGIVTSDTRAIGNGDLVSIGVAKVSEVRNVTDTATTTFAGQTVLGNDVLAMVTWGGDANLDGKINIDDYGRIDGNVGQSGSVFGWSRGDFNYDGKINIDDYGIIDGNINRQGATFGSGDVGSIVAVPEPVFLGTACLALLLPCRRRRCS